MLYLQQCLPKKDIKMHTAYILIWIISTRLIFSDGKYLVSISDSLNSTYFIYNADFPSMADVNTLQFPWIWDAVFDPNEALVSLTSVNRGKLQLNTISRIM